MTPTRPDAPAAFARGSSKGEVNVAPEDQALKALH